MDSTPVYFWRETGEEGYLSQWWSADPFRLFSSSSSSSPITFKTAEHFMMHGKAMLFDDPASALAVLRADHPRRAKALGRRVAGFDEALWLAHRERVVREGNLLKFRASPELRARLLATGSRELVEANPRDRIWGIGFGPERAPATDRARWGLNLLGKVLMEVRARLREEDEREDDEFERANGRRRKRKREDGAGEDGRKKHQREFGGDDADVVRMR